MSTSIYIYTKKDSSIACLRGGGDPKLSIYPSIYLSMQVCICLSIYLGLGVSPAARASQPSEIRRSRAWVGLYKILVYFEAFVHESIILLSPPPTCTDRTIAILLHVYCAIYDAPPTPLVYAIHHTLLVMTISCNGQPEGGGYRHRRGLPYVAGLGYHAGRSSVDRVNPCVSG